MRKKQPLATTKFKIEYVPPDILKPADYNPRKVSDAQKVQLKKSMTEHDFVDPIIVNKAKNRKNIIIGGHLRVVIAKELKLEAVPVVYVNIPDVDEEKKLNLRLNRTGGEFDYQLLRDFDIEMLLDTGFEEIDLRDMWDEVLGIENDDFDTQKAIDAARKNPKTQIGQLFQLGTHRLLCGDSTNLVDVQRLMNGESVSMVISDPPFQIGLSYDKGISGKKNYGGQEKDKRSPEEYRQFLFDTMQNAKAQCSKNTHFFYWCDQNYIGLVQELYEQLKIKKQRVCLWIKNNQNVTPKNAFNKCYEPCVYGTIGKPEIYATANVTEILNQEVDTGNRTIDDILDLLDIWLCKRIPTNEYMHPTQKPVTLLEKPLRRCTQVNDAVLDSFGGSGTTLIACEQLKRRAFLMEKDPVFCDVIIERWETLTGKKAVLLEETEMAEVPDKSRKKKRKSKKQKNTKKSATPNPKSNA